MKKIRAEITETGAKITLNLSPSETIVGELHYLFHKNKSDVKVTVRTPFGAYTKQELILSLNGPAYNQFSGVIGLTWKDINVITINASGYLDGGPDFNKAMLSISSVNDPSVFGFKQGSFLVENTKSDCYFYYLDSIIEGSYDGVQVIKGVIQFGTETKSDSKGARFHLIAAGIEYKLDGQYDVSPDGYVGEAEISVETPYDISKFTVEGKLKRNSMNKRDAYLKIIHPSGYFLVQTNYELSPSMEFSSIASIILRSILTPDISASINVEEFHKCDRWGSHSQHYGGSLRLRNNAPYEVEGRWNGRFHIMMDSIIRTILFTQLGFIQ